MRPPCPRSAALLLPIALVGALACGEPPAVRVETAPAPGAGPAASTPASDPPRAVAFDPPLDALDVDPGRTTLSVTFDREMQREGWAWVIEDESTAPELGESSWDPAGRTQTVAVALRPGTRYVVWVNSPQFAYFRDLQGVAATPVRWTFATAGEAPVGPATAAGGVPAGGAPAAPFAPQPAHAPTGPPRIVALEPANGATGVDPALDRLVVHFDRAMAEGWSWVTEGGDSFPERAGEAGQSFDRRSAFLPVRLEPGRSYVVWLNSEAYLNFRDPEGRVLPPLRWTFTTAARP